MVLLIFVLTFFFHKVYINQKISNRREKAIIDDSLNFWEIYLFKLGLD